MPKMSKHRAYAFTSFEMEELIFGGKSPKFEYLIIGFEECPTTKRKHIQGYIYFKNPRSFNSVKRLLGKAHVEAAKGTPQENRKYCAKGGLFKEFGKIPEQGKRNDILALRNAIIEGKTDYEIIVDDGLCETYARYIKFADRCRETVQKEQAKTFRKLEVIVLYGPAGTGKTRYVYENERDVYTLTQAQKEVWFDGYCGEKVLIIDDFYGWIKWAFMLKLLDGHPCRLNKKGGGGYALWEKVYVTSNKPPWEWYKKGYPDELKRRINSIVYFVNGGTEVRGNTMPELQEAEGTPFLLF